MKKNIPVFNLDIHSPDKIKEANRFHNRIIEFVELNLSGEEDSDILCYMNDNETGDVLEANLPRAAYRQSLLKSLDFFTENENYEKCIVLKEILSKI